MQPNRSNPPKLPRLLRQLGGTHATGGNVQQADGRRLGWLSAALLVATLGGRLGHWSWLLELVSHFTAHLLLAGVVLLGACVWRKDRLAGALVLLSLAINLWTIAPLYFRATDTEVGRVDSGAQLRLCAFNLLGDNPEQAQVVAYLKTAPCDVVFLFEVRPSFVKPLQSLSTSYPLIETEARPDNFGIAVISRLEQTKTQFLRTPFADTAMIEARLTVGATAWNLLGAHPPPPVSGQLAAARNATLAMVAAWARRQTGPTVVAGDFNLTPYSPYFSQLLDDGALANSMRGFGLQTSWPNGIGFLGGLCRIPVDHVLHSRDVITVQRIVGPSLGSDHQPILTVLGPRRR